MNHWPEAYSLRARWVLPQPDQVCHGGVISIVNGRITRGELPAGALQFDLGDVLLLPGLVNTHAHLEFSTLEQPIPPRGTFTEWLDQVIAWRVSQSAAGGEGVRRGLAEVTHAGTALLADIDTGCWPDLSGDAAFPVAEIRPAGFTEVLRLRELIGLLPARIAMMSDLGSTWLGSTFIGVANGGRGLSPHATYTVHPTLLETSVRLAAEQGSVVAMHVAECAAERELLATGNGEFRSFLDAKGLWPEDGFTGRTLLSVLQTLSQAPRALVIHGNWLDEAELAFLATQPQMTLVYCPRTHAAFGHPPHPWRNLLQRGGQVALGTDGRSSNPDLSLLHELQFLHSLEPTVDPTLLWELGTMGGARALGREADFGHLQPGAVASLVAISPGAPLRADATARECAEGVLHPQSRVAGVILRGQPVLESFADSDELGRPSQQRT